MIQKIKTALTTALIAVSMASPVIALPASVYAADYNGSKSAACDGIGLAGSNCGGNADDNVKKIIRTIVNVLSIIIGAIAVIMIIVAGLKYITAGGDSNNVAGAKNTLIYAAVGLVVVALAQTIVYFVLGQADKLAG